MEEVGKATAPKGDNTHKGTDFCMKELDEDLDMVVWRALCGEVGGMGAWKVTGAQW